MPSAPLRAAFAALAAAACLTACAAGGPGPSAGDVRRFGGSDAPGAPERGRGDLNVFISPSGEPFHGGRDAPYASAEWFARADTDHDGRLTLAEFRADALRAFALYDADRNGVIDAFEIQAYEQSIAPEILPRFEGLRADEGMDESLFKRRGGGRGGGRRGGSSTPQGASRRQVASDRQAQGGGLYGMLAEPEPLTAADLDLSGSVTRAEWMARTDRRFVLLDTAGRGYLALADLPKTQAELLLERRRARETAARRSGAAPPPR